MGNKSGIAEAAKHIADPLKITTPDGYTVDFDATKAAEKAEALAFLAEHKALEISEAQRLAWQAQELAHLRDTEAAFRRMEAEAQHLRIRSPKQAPIAAIQRLRPSLLNPDRQNRDQRPHQKGVRGKNQSVARLHWQIGHAGRDYPRKPFRTFKHGWPKTIP